MVTSGLFSLSLIGPLTPSSQALLLRAYLVTVLTWWVARGSPALKIKILHWYPHPLTLPFYSPREATALSPRRSIPIPKIQRSSAHFSTPYGNRPARYHKSTELEGAEIIDGSLFVRTALLTANYMGEANTREC
ncbi:hypothetical protein F5J12DRAFT_842659 [Pisolithus orientalis]|uniref:uncharacterized protein n=1 Tax=Pisolithus orientalis TaxID=936130 RepID=UPI0022247178|nr:uncharacterized protein F5J12DRAFT_842659 [Pisolithus orientalis]KAI6002331.1 hypothetical protein F5J12DRAFT_842659 [Pisolithus orientalis]